jgi:hypothetical protein
MDGREALEPERRLNRCAVGAQPAERREMAIHDVGGHHTPSPARVAGMDRGPSRQEDDGDDRDAIVAGEPDEGEPRVALDVRGVDDDETARPEAATDLSMEDREGDLRCSLVRLVARHGPAQRVRGEDLGGVEVCGGERRLADARGADEDDDAGNVDRDRRGAVSW